MKCESCDSASATLQCLECKVEDDETPLQLCDSCSGVIHKGRMKNHAVTQREIDVKKTYLKEKLEDAYNLRPGLETRVSDIAAAKAELQTRIRTYERELRAAVTDLQNKVKDRCRSLYTGIRDEINNTCSQLNEHEHLLKEQMIAIDQVAQEVEAAMSENEENLMANVASLEVKLSDCCQTKLKKNLPDLDIDVSVDLGDVVSSIQAINFKRKDTAQPINIPPVEVKEGTTLKVYIAGRMTKDSTFCVQPADLGDEVYSMLDRINNAVRTQYLENLDWQTFADCGTNPEIGESVFVLYKSDSKWYRARVEEARPDKTYTVLYTDFGNIEHVNPKYMLPVREGVIPDVPRQTLECSLFNSLRSDLNNAAKWAFNDAVQQMECSCTFNRKWALEGASQEIWQVSLTVEQEDKTVVDVAALVEAELNEASWAKSAISCRDVRLIDNPEIYSKLTTLTIERPSSEVSANVNKTTTATTDDTVLNGTAGNPAAAEEESVQASTEEDTETSEAPYQGEGTCAEASIRPMDEPDQTQVQVVNHDNTDTDQKMANEPVISDQHQRSPNRVDTCASQSLSPDAVAASDGEDVEPVAPEALAQARRLVADSPSGDDYQSAASSLDEASGSITPVSASSHLSGPPPQAAPGYLVGVNDNQQSEHVVEERKRGERRPTGGSRSGDGEEGAKPEKSRKKKKKKRRDSERNDEDSKAHSTEPGDHEVAPAEQKRKPFIVREWLSQSGTDSPDHQKLRQNLQGLANLMSRASYTLGEVILAPDDREVWQRAVVTNMKARKVDVHFLDVAKVRSVLLDNTRSLLPKLRDLPPAVVLPEPVQQLLCEQYDDTQEDTAVVTPNPGPPPAVTPVQEQASSETGCAFGDQQMEDNSEQAPVAYEEDSGEANDYMPPNQAAPYQHQESNFGEGRGPLDARRRRYGEPERYDSRYRGQRGNRNDRCYQCNQLGHYSAECPNQKASGKGGGGGGGYGWNNARRDSGRNRNDRRQGGKSRHQHRYNGGDDRPRRSDRQTDSDRGGGGGRYGGSGDGRQADAW